ncbi:MAG TPA: M48 family metallopeptidase [Candidatus Nitrosotenuis sp.]|nr:M48 family metallopeptidase [Candidatus Nitrosotenuis sp.]
MKRLSILAVLMLLAAAPARADLTADQRSQLSEQMLAEIVKVNGPVQPLDDRARVAQVFYSIASLSQRPEIHYRVSVVEKPDINAYSLPDGRVVFFRGLLDSLPRDDDNALAFVAAHEIAHIERRHAERTVENRVATGLPIVIVARILGGGRGKEWVGALGGLAFGLVTSGYSRELETEADRRGFELMQKAGYDPNGALVVFKLFKEHEGHGLKVFPSHPDPDDRYRNVVAWIQEAGLALREPGAPTVALTPLEPVWEDPEPGTRGGAESSGGGDPREASAGSSPGALAAAPSSGWLPQPLYNEFSTPSELKRGQFLSHWEERLARDLRQRLGAQLEPSEEARRRARSITYGTCPSRDEDGQVLLVFMLDGTWTYEMFLEHFDREQLPHLRPRAQSFTVLGVAAKRNLRNKTHVVILLESGP